MKICGKCKIEKHIDCFTKDSTKSDGLRTVCRYCTNENNRLIYHRNPEASKQRTKQYKELNKERIAKYQKEYISKWNRKNKHRKNAADARRRARMYTKIAAMHKELTDLVYATCPEGMHVDHIVPLNGKTISGLHVPWNLQYLTPEENIKKGNKYPNQYD